jgi:hypothetical protein
MSYDYFSIIEEGRRDYQRFEESRQQEEIPQRVQCPDCQTWHYPDFSHSCICPLCKGDYWSDLFAKCSNCLKGRVYKEGSK